MIAVSGFYTARHRWITKNGRALFKKMNLCKLKRFKNLLWMMSLFMVKALKIHSLTMSEA